MKVFLTFLIVVLQIQILGSFEGESCTRAMTPWIKKMGKDLIKHEKKGLGFSMRDGNKIQKHYINQTFPYKIVSYEGNPEDTGEIYQSTVDKKEYVFDFKAVKHGKLKESTGEKEYIKFTLKRMKNLEKSPYLLFFERVFLFNEGKNLTNFEKTTIESCLGALLASNSSQELGIEEISNKLRLRNTNIRKVAGKNETIHKKIKTTPNSTQAQ